MLALQPYSVGHLIDQNTKVWNEPLIQHLFATETTQNISFVATLRDLKIMFSSLG